METTSRFNRIHPLMASAPVSVLIVSLTGAAAITGLLPNSNSADTQAAPLAAASPYAMQPGMVPMTNAQGQVVMVPAAAVQAAPLSATPVTPQLATQLAAGPQMMPVAYAQPVAQPAPAPVVIKEVIREKPVVKVVEKTRVVHAKASEPRYYPQHAPAPAPAQPNYVGIGTGAVIGGLIGNQIGGGNGKKLATVAGIIGGGMLGNEIANRNR
jgi:uncharacterized protein YcfJ